MARLGTVQHTKYNVPVGTDYKNINCTGNLWHCDKKQYVGIHRFVRLHFGDAVLPFLLKTFNLLEIQCYLLGTILLVQITEHANRQCDMLMYAGCKSMYDGFNKF